MSSVIGNHLQRRFPETPFIRSLLEYTYRKIARLLGMQNVADIPLPEIYRRRSDPDYARRRKLITGANPVVDLDTILGDLKELSERSTMALADAEEHLKERQQEIDRLMSDLQHLETREAALESQIDVLSTQTPESARVYATLVNEVLQQREERTFRIALLQGLVWFVLGGALTAGLAIALS